jgi:hypothetical protein
LKNNILARNPESKDNLEYLLKAQEKLINSNEIEMAKMLLELSKKNLEKVITEKEIVNLCQLQETIIKLQININQQEKQLVQIINNISGDINVQGVNVIIGTNINQANFSCNNELIELPSEESEAKMEMPL